MNSKAEQNRILTLKNLELRQQIHELEMKVSQLESALQTQVTRAVNHYNAVMAEIRANSCMRDGYEELQAGLTASAFGRAKYDAAYRVMLMAMIQRGEDRMSIECWKTIEEAVRSKVSSEEELQLRLNEFGLELDE